MIKVQFADKADFYNVTFKRINPHVVALQGNVEVLTMQNTSGFNTYRDCLIPDTNDEDDNILGRFPGYTTVYRVTENSIMYSDDNSVWKEPTENRVISAEWYDHENIDGIRPESITVTVQGYGDVELKASNDWMCVISDVPISTPACIEAVEELEGYESTIGVAMVIYTHDPIDNENHDEINLEDRVADLEDATIELYELVLAEEE